MGIGLIGVIITVILITYSLTKHFQENKRKFEEEWGEKTHQSSTDKKQLQGFYLAIYNRCIYIMIQYEKEHNTDIITPFRSKIEDFLLKYDNRPDEGNAEQVALTILWNFTSDALKCGQYHFHIGSLTTEGEALLQFSLHCLESAENAGYISSNDAKEARNALFQSIREAG